MEAYIVFGIFAAAFLVFVFAREAYEDCKKEKQFIEKLYRDYGKVPQREYSAQRYMAITTFFRRHPVEGQIDDITWNDLSFDDIFKRLNDTYSSAGEEYLYYTLRTPVYNEKELKHFDKLVEYFRNNPDDRVKMQVNLAKLGRTGKFSLYDYLEHLDVLGNRSNWKHYIADGLLLAAIVLCFFVPSYGLLAVIAILIYNILSYFKEKNEIDTYITSFAYVMRLLNATEKIGKLKIDVCREELEEIEYHRKQMTLFKTGAFWIMSAGRMSGSGNPLDIIFDYLRMCLHFDLIKFNNMLAQVRLHIEDIDVMVQKLGYIETAIAVGGFRTAQEGQWCKPNFVEEKCLEAQNAYHPMIENPVKNSIVTKKGVLLTGSNASGKSTFLKTMAIAGIFAQTIYTCPADYYKSCFLRVCSSMALRDDLNSGESYYIVEIKSIKRILDIAAESGMNVLCFVDEVLRGTNTVERIAASTQILKGLAKKNVLCFAATHDIELTGLLEEDFDNYHFEETVANGDISFNYKLLDGKATTRNAIKLLEMMGYDKKIIEKAEKQAAVFIETGAWEKDDKL
ncbi:MAG: hypothetical protein IJ282_10675 [Lachnospiraceae bacterium]|nr:hypothetical protein [Lachnospiraceae bacterium]